MDTLTPRYTIARDGRKWRAYDQQHLGFVGAFHNRKADARKHAKILNDACGLPSYTGRNEPPSR